MNRETKRMLQRQGQLDKDGEFSQRATSPAVKSRSEGGGIRNYFKSVRSELRKVNWASRKDVINYSTVVLSSLVILIALIFLFNFVFSKAVLFLFK